MAMDIFFDTYSTDTPDGRSPAEWEKFGFAQLLKLGAYLDVPIFESSEELARKCFVYKEYEKGQVLFSTEKPTDAVIFLIDGAAKVGYVQDNEERIINLYGPGSLATANGKLFHNSYDNVNIEIIKRTKALVATVAGIQELLTLPEYSHIPEIVFNKINILALTFHRQLGTFLGLDNQSKIERAMDSFPSMFEHVPSKYIAEFLGMKPESFSRLRKADSTL